MASGWKQCSVTYMTSGIKKRGGGEAEGWDVF